MNRARKAGAASVEFAIVGAAFVSLMLLAMEAGWQIVTDAALGAGARAASRFGTTGATAPAGMTPPPTSRTDSITQLVIQNSGGLLQASQLTIAETSYPSFASIGISGTGSPGPGKGDQVVQYTFVYTQPYLTPIAIAITGSQQLVHTVAVTVLNEPFPSS
jgi:hypothetical protein